MIALLALMPAGLLLGVVINYLADVLPYTRRFSQPVCANCGQTMSWRAYLGFQACQSCGKSRRLRNWFIPVIGAALVSLFWFYPPPRIGFWWAVILLGYFSLVAITDLEYHAILNPVSWVGAGLGAAFGSLQHGWLSTLIGGAAGFLAMLALFYVGRLFGRYMSRRRGVPIEDEEALGFGDVNLTGILGLVLGWPGITAGLFLGIMFAGLYGVVYLVYGLITRRYQPGTFLPYAPFLIMGAAFLLFAR